MKPHFSYRHLEGPGSQTPFQASIKKGFIQIMGFTPIHYDRAELCSNLRDYNYSAFPIYSTIKLLNFI